MGFDAEDGVRVGVRDTGPGLSPEKLANAIERLHYSTVHGAGRLFGRKEAKRRFTREQMDRWLQDRGVTLIGEKRNPYQLAHRLCPH